jgi:CubicO group peptidase (beta-lactamase class C family)
MRLLKNFSLSTLVILASLNVYSASPVAPESNRVVQERNFDELDKVVLAELKEKNTPGAVISIVQGDRVVYQKAFGLANVETGAEMKPEMLFRLGSTTKMFTAAALVTLSEQKKINLNTPIGNYVKGLDPKIGRVTGDHLLSNSAGIRDFAAPAPSNDDAALGNMVRSWKEDIFFADPGEIYSYSSAGFWLSGFVVETLQQKPYADSMEEIVFKPLGMNRTTLRPLMAMTYPLSAAHAVEDGKAKIIRPFFNNVAMWPAGSIFSNAGDLSRWVTAFLNEGRLEGKQVLSPTLIKQMSGHHIPVPGETDSYYCYGLTSFKYSGLEFVGHGGFSRGYGSMIQMVPEKKFAVIILTNKSGETLRQSLGKATEIGLGLKDEVTAKTESLAALSKAAMDQYVGTYSHVPQTWEVFEKDGELQMKFDGSESLMTRTGENKFTFGQSNENEVVFVKGKSGKIGFLYTEIYAAKKIK